MGVNDVSVGLWEWLDEATWAKVGEVSGWSSLAVEQRHLQPGPWTITMPYNAQAAKINKKQLLTFDFRSQRLTGVVEHVSPQSGDDGSTVLEVSGVDAMTLLGDVLCYPVPTADLTGQTVARYEDTGVTETVLRRLISLNYTRHYGGQRFAAVYAPDQGRGKQTSTSLRFHNLLARVLGHCTTGGIGVTVGLQETTSSTRADLTVDFYEPKDMSLRVRLSHKVGTLRSWSQSDDVPTGTRVIEAGSGTGPARILHPVVADDVEAEWGRKRELFEDARDTSVLAELDARGAEDLADATEQSSFDLEAEDAEGMRYGDHFSIGDFVTIELMTGLSKVDRLNVVTLTSDSSGAKVQLKPGNPDAANPLFAQAAIIRGLRKQVRDLQLED